MSTFVEKTEPDRIDIAVGGISRLLKGLPLEDLLLVGELVEEAIEVARADLRQQFSVLHGDEPESEAST